jgi:hypothetical protein
MNYLLTLIPYAVFFWLCIVIAAVVECIILHFKLLDERKVHKLNESLLLHYRG